MRKASGLQRTGQAAAVDEKALRSGNPGRADWVRFGWQGISGLVPRDWNLGALGGEYKQGYLRLDDPDYPRLDVKWSFQNVELSKILDKYLHSMGRPKGVAGIGKKPLATVTRDVKVVSNRAKPDKRLLGFSWHDNTGLKGAGVIWACQGCGRIVFSQVRAYGSEDAVALAREVLGTIEDHAIAGNNCWAVYGLECEVPERFHLIKQGLMAGYIELLFQDRRRNLRVSRWGLAANLLEKKSLTEWFDSNAATVKSPLLWWANDAIVKGHPGLMATGEPLRLPVRLQKAALGLGYRLLGRRELLGRPDGLSRVWHCPESNRLFLVEATVRPAEAEVDGVVDSIRCHGQESR